MKYLLDTTVLLDFAHGRAGVVELVDRLFADAETLYTCDVVTCEALSGGNHLERSVIEGVLDALEYVALAPTVPDGQLRPDAPVALRRGLEVWRTCSSRRPPGAWRPPWSRGIHVTSSAMGSAS